MLISTHDAPKETTKVSQTEIWAKFDAKINST